MYVCLICIKHFQAPFMQCRKAIKQGGTLWNWNPWFIIVTNQTELIGWLNKTKNLYHSHYLSKNYLSIPPGKSNMITQNFIKRISLRSRVVMSSSSKMLQFYQNLCHHHVFLLTIWPCSYHISSQFFTGWNYESTGKINKW